MKKLLLLICALLGLGASGAWAQDGTVVATMSDLVTGAGFNNAKTVKENSIYSCAYNTYLGSIDNSAVTTAYEGSGYVTVAMWIWGNSASGCLFGYGDQNTGVKYKISGGATVQTTTKGVKDFSTQNLNDGQTRVAADQWNLIAFAIPAKNGTWGDYQARYYATTTDNQYWSMSTGATKMSDPASKKCAIGSGNQGGAREPFNGIIANVTVIQSTGLLNNSRIAALVGPAPSSTVWYKPAMGGRTWTWNTTNSNYDSSDETAATGTPARTTSEGPLYRYNSVGTLSATGNANTSDKGGAWVLGTQQNPSNVTVSLGAWAGSIDVETWQVANVSYSIDLKGTEPSCCSTVWVDGDLNFGSRSSCSINDGGDQRWYIGENGIIHSSFTSVSKGSREWNFQIVVANDPQVGETDTRIVHTRTRKVMTWGADIHSNIDNVKVFHKGDDGTLTEKNTTNDTNFEVTYDANGMYVTYTCKGYFNTNDPNYTYTYSSGVGTSESRVYINHNGGTVNLTGAEETHYLTGSNSATQTTVTFDGTTVNYSNELGIGKATYNIHNTKVTTPKFITSQGGAGRSSVVNLTGNTVITVTGSTNADNNTSSVMIGHWNGSSDLTLSGTAKIEAVDAQLLVGLTGNTQTITLNGSSNITAKGIKTSTNASGTNTLNLNGGSLTLGDVGITSYSGSRTISVNVTENSTIKASASTLPISQAITIAAGKTLTIDGDNNTVDLASAPAPTLGTGSSINFQNATVTLNVSDRNLSRYTFTSCTATAKFVETGTEYAAGGFTITNVPSGVTTIKVKKYGSSDYEDVTVVAGTATFSHVVGVSGSAAWLDYTFNESTKVSNTHSPADRVIDNAGNAGTTGHNLTIDTGYDTSNSYNDDGTLKVMSTPWRDITWPTNYTVAVAGNVPDEENGCLVAFGSSVYGSKNYLAIIRGASQNEIKLVKANGSTAYEVISTMTATNATALSHLVVFTKNGSTFTVYLDGVQKAQVTYSEALGTGFQIGSVHGGVGSSGIVRVNGMSDAIKEKVFAKAIRVYDYVISSDQMEQLTTEFPYVSFGGKYSRTISASSNLSATNAWLNNSTQGNVDIPANAIVEEVTYHPDIEITTTAASTLTVNADMDADNIKFEGTGKLTIVSDGSHNISVYGSVTANGPISVKYGETDLSGVPVSIGEDGSIEFDFSDYDFSGVTTSTDYPVTGNTSNYGDKVTAVYPIDDYHTYSLAFNGTTNSYYLTVGPTVKLKQEMAIDLVTPYYNGGIVGTAIGRYTIKLGETSYANMKDFGDAVTAWATLGDCVEPTITLNTPSAGYYRLRNVDTNGYLKATALAANYLDSNKYVFANGNDTEAATVIEIRNGVDGPYMYNQSYGFGWVNAGDASTGVGWITSSPDKYVHWFPGTSAGQIAFAICFGNGTGANADYLKKGIYKADKSDGDAVIGGTDETADAAQWIVEEATSVTIALNSVGGKYYATFSAPFDVTIGSDATAYQIDLDLERNRAVYSEITDNKVPAGAGVLLISDEANSVTATINTGAAFSALVGNDLVGYNIAPTFNYPDETTDWNLVLGVADETIGFYQMGTGTASPNKAYLPYPHTASGGGVKGFALISAEELETGIDNLKPTKKTESIYDLSGRRVSKPTRGLYIKNGQKIAVK